MNTCSTCKYYQPNIIEHLGACSKWMTGYNWSPKEVPNNEVIVEDDEGWAANMGPDFGCVLWESK